MSIESCCALGADCIYGACPFWGTPQHREPVPDPLEAAAKAEAEVARCMVHIGDNGCNDGCLDCARHRVEAIAPILTAPLLAETARLTRELEEATKTRETLSQMHLQMCDLATERFSALSTVEAERDRLRKAATNLRAAQRAYMANRGNDELGRAVAAAAQAMDDTLLGETGR